MGVIHVGAWKGLEYRDAEGPLILFEPQAGPFAYLEARFGGREDVELVNVALGAKEGTATMHTAHPDHSSSLLSPRQTRSDITFAGTEEVRMVTLDEAMKGKKGFDTLRIDTQGYELEVLRGATETLKTIKRIEIEVHDPNTYPGAGSLAEIDALLSPRFVRIAFDTEASDDLGDATYALAD